MRLSRTLAYAIYSILQLAKAPSGMSVSRNQLAITAQLPERFLLEVLHSLNGGGLVRSTRGVDGGFSLARAPGDITLKDILEAFDYPQAPYIPEIDRQYNEVNDRILAVLKNARSAAQMELQKMSVAELLPYCIAQPVVARSIKPPYFNNDSSDLASTTGENASV